MSSKEVQEVLEELRDTLGRRVPKHNEIGIGVVEKKCVSVQGIWRNAPDLWYPELPETAETRERRSQTHGLQTLFDDVGITGVISTTQKLLDREATAKQLALDALPRAERILPTE